MHSSRLIMINTSLTQCRYFLLEADYPRSKKRQKPGKTTEVKQKIRDG